MKFTDFDLIFSYNSLKVCFLLLFFTFYFKSTFIFYSKRSLTKKDNQLKRSVFRKGMVLVDPKALPTAVRELNPNLKWNI